MACEGSGGHLAFARAGVQDAWRMLACARLPFVRLVIVALVAMLGAGSGLSGLVRALAPSEHVCTCVSGGSHASCPVCNPALGRRTHSHSCAIDGVPCGERGGAIQVAGDPAVVAPPPNVGSCPFSRASAPVATRAELLDVSSKPTTPPPRIASV